MTSTDQRQLLGAFAEMLAYPMLALPDTHNVYGSVLTALREEVAE